MNKPVAWMLNGILHECDPSDWAKEQYPDQDVIPLYTTPQIKELSDEEIIKIRQRTKPKNTENWADTLAFAKAIEERHGIK